MRQLAQNLDQIFIACQSHAITLFIVSFTINWFIRVLFPCDMGFACIKLFRRRVQKWNSNLLAVFVVVVIAKMVQFNGFHSIDALSVMNRLLWYNYRLINFGNQSKSKLTYFLPWKIPFCILRKITHENAKKN